MTSESERRRELLKQWERPLDPGRVNDLLEELIAQPIRPVPPPMGSGQSNAGVYIFKDKEGRVVYVGDDPPTARGNALQDAHGYQFLEVADTQARRALVAVANFRLRPELFGTAGAPFETAS